MTNKEALIAVLRVSVLDNTLIKAMLDQDVSEEATYSKEGAKSIDLCAIDVLLGLLSEPDVSEGGYSVKYDRSAVIKHLVALAEKHGISSVLETYKPKVTALQW